MPQPEHPEPAATHSFETARDAAALPAKNDLAIEYCPNCSAKLVGHSCKMKCPRCGYFLSCSDYY